MHLVNGQGVESGRTFMPRQEIPGHSRMKLQALGATVTDAAAVTAAAYSTIQRPISWRAQYFLWCTEWWLSLLA